MEYKEEFSEEIVKKLIKIKKKDLIHYSNIKRKINFITKNPNHNYKFLHYSMKQFNRIHIGHFVLVFRINQDKKIISFEDYDHHDNIYLK